MNVEESMIKIVYSVPPDTLVEEAVKTMNTHEIGCLLVTQEERPIGIVTERDLLKRVLEQGKNPHAIKVNEIMSLPLVYGNPEMELEDAARLIFRRKVKKTAHNAKRQTRRTNQAHRPARTAHIDQKMMHVISELIESGWLPPKRMEKIINVYLT